MNFTTSNYRAARSVFGIAEFVLWCGFGLGIILAIVAAGAASNGFGSPGILAAAPGLAFSILCFIGMVIVQIGKAGVDSADFAYQSLAIARQQLEISKQALKQDAKVLSFADRAQISPLENPIRSVEPETTSYGTPPAVSASKDTARDWDYRDTRIHRTEHGFLVEGQTFQSLGDAKRYVDQSRPAQRQEQPVRVAQPEQSKEWVYRHNRINKTQEGYLIKGQVFETLELAKNFVDGEALRASLTSST